MNWAAAAALCAAFGVLTTIVSVAYVSGKLTQRIDTSSETIDAHALMLKEHGETLGEHAIDLGRLHEWKNGFNAAASVSGGKQLAESKSPEDQS